MTIKQSIKWNWITVRWKVLDFFSKLIYKIARFFANKDMENSGKRGLWAKLAYHSAIIYGSIVEAKGRIADESTEFVDALKRQTR